MPNVREILQFHCEFWLLAVSDWLFAQIGKLSELSLLTRFYVGDVVTVVFVVATFWAISDICGESSKSGTGIDGGDGGGIGSGSRSNVKVPWDDHAHLVSTGFASGKSLQIVLMFILKPIEREGVTFWKTIL